MKYLKIPELTMVLDRKTQCMENKVAWASFQILGESHILLFLEVKPEFISNNISSQ